MKADMRRKPALLGALLVIATLLLYVPVIHHDFIYYDDRGYVTDNVHVRTGLTVNNIVWAFTTFEQYNWHPLTWLSHMLDCQLFGLSSGSHHYVNVLLHAANVLLLFLLLQRATGALCRSFLVSALFAVHPLNVETVAWVAQRKSLLSAFFFMLTIAAYGWYVRRVGWKWYLIIVCAFGLALMSKPMAMTAPLLLLLLDYWPLKRLEEIPFSRRITRLVTEKFPLLFISVAFSVLTGLAQRSGGSMVPFSVLPLSTRLGNAFIAYVTYISKMLWPAKLAVFYPYTALTLGQSPPWDEVIASAIVLGGVTAFVLYFHRARYLAVGWFFFLIALFPVIGIVQVGSQSMADRYAYIPCIGLFIALVWGLDAMVENMRITRIIPLLGALCLIAGFASATVHYLKYWQNGVILFSQAQAAWGRPDPELEELYANALLTDGQVDDALRLYKESCVLGPRNQYCHYWIAQILFRRYQLPEAVHECQVAVALNGRTHMALTCLTDSADALLVLGEYDAAAKAAADALSIDANNPVALSLRDRIFSRRR
jgi:protein O-mannosyl-transferase